MECYVQFSGLAPFCDNAYSDESAPSEEFLCKLDKALKHQSRLQQTAFIKLFHCFSGKIRINISCESSAWQRIHMKHQALFSLKEKTKKKKKKKKLKCRLLQFLFGA